MNSALARLRQFRPEYVINIGVVILLFVITLVLLGLTSLSVGARDSSTLVWQGPASVAPKLDDTGVVVQWPRNEDTFHVSHSAAIALVANTPIAERTELPVDCEEYASGRKQCRFGGYEEWYLLH